jgi:hypothetical protein
MRKRRDLSAIHMWMRDVTDRRASLAVCHITHWIVMQVLGYVNTIVCTCHPGPSDLTSFSPNQAPRPLPLMAAVHPPAIATHPGPDPFRKPSHQIPLSRSAFRLNDVALPVSPLPSPHYLCSKPPFQSALPPNHPSSAHAIPIHPTSKPDPFYGHEYIARLCAQFIAHRFTCPK